MRMNKRRQEILKVEPMELNDEIMRKESVRYLPLCTLAASVFILTVRQGPQDLDTYTKGVLSFL